MTDPIALVNEQAEDEGLWFIDATCSEAYLQAALRKLHAAIEARVPAATPSNPTRELTAIAAECHRAKWQFGLNEDFKPSKSEARALILQAFHELHRIGDLAMKARDAVTVSRPDREAAMRVLASDLAEEMEADAVSSQHSQGE